MSTLTRIFIVLMVIFSIAFTMTTISFVAKSNDWKKLAQAYQAEQLLVETNMRNLAAAHAVDRAVWLDRQRELETQVAAFKASEVNQLADVAEAKDEIAGLRSEKSDGAALVSRLTSELQVAQNGWLKQRSQRSTLEKRKLELVRRNLDLSERVNEQTAQILVLVQQSRQLEQQVNILREENAKLARGAGLGTAALTAGTATTTGATPVAAPAATPIRGHIIEVQGKLATISVGSSDGVRENMVFVVYRGSEYVADIEITDVNPNLSAGRIIRSRATPRPQDTVADEPALGLAQ